MYHIEISQHFKAVQGLKSPVRTAKGLPNLVPEEGFSVAIRVGVEFRDSQLTERRWFVDTDTIEDVVAESVSHLTSDKWTTLFEFRPTFEAVSRWVYENLKPKIPQLSYVELDNEGISVKTRYTPESLNLLSQCLYLVAK